MFKFPPRLLSVQYKLTRRGIATSWNGWGMTTGTCSVHSWNDNGTEDEGDSPLGRSYDSQLRPMPREPSREEAPVGSHRLRSRAVRASQLFADDDDDDDEPLVW